MSLGLIPRHGITGSKAMHILALVYLPQISLQKDDCSYTPSDGKEKTSSAVPLCTEILFIFTHYQ